MTLTLREFLAQLGEYGIFEPILDHPFDVVIRTDSGDHALAAVHREGPRLILDLGHKLNDGVA